MRDWIPLAAAAALTLLLAGCSSPGPADTSAQADPLVALEPAVLVDGSFKWHDPGPSQPMDAYNLASQLGAHPCVWDGPNGREPYFNNLELPTASSPYPAWSGNLSVALDWTDSDWVGTSLRIAYEGPAVEDWQEAGPIERGVPFVEPVRFTAEDANATEDGDGADGADAADSPSWSVWVCLPTDTLNPESPFVGSVTAHIAFQPDPMPASRLQPESEPDRTGRQG